MRKRWVWALIMLGMFGYLICGSAIERDTVYAKGILRLHILANSDTQEDQRVKLEVRNGVLAFIEENIPETSAKDEVQSWTDSHLQDIEAEANRILMTEGVQYTAAAEMGTFEFPDRVYGGIDYPAGIYDALRIRLGASEGKNWWCVIFPPLCLTDLGIAPPEATQSIQVKPAPEKTTAPVMAEPSGTSPGQGTKASPTASLEATPEASPEPTPEATPVPAQTETNGGIHYTSIFWEWLFG